MALSALKKLVAGLSRTRENLVTGLRTLGRSAELGEDELEDLETGLLAADLGPDLVEEVIAAVGVAARRGEEPRAAVRAALLPALLAESVPRERMAGRPHVIFVVGVNGGGKTTTVGKLAALEKAAGRQTLVVAADTFRAAAIDQLERWTERVGVELVKQKDGADPASVVFDALRAGRARGAQTILVDTAGRLHTKSNLMAELAKLSRVASREVEQAPHEVLLVVDATTGQNGLSQAEEFTRAAALTGVVLTKLDGTAKGGVALGIQRKLGVPIRYVGVGEAVDDLLEFDAEAYLEGLLG